jgi:tetratricopeptide (TPR) repeat protein
MRRVIFIEVFITAFIVGGFGHAQDDTDGDDDQAKAAAGYAEGKKAFEAGKFDDALKKFTEVYNLSGKGDLLCDLAICSEKLGQPDKARAYYDLYLEENPEVKNAPAVCAEIVARDDSGDQTPVKPIETETETEGEVVEEWPPVAQREQFDIEPLVKKKKNNEKTLGPGLMIGVGGLVVVSGGLTAIAAYKKHRDLEIACSPDCTDGQVDSAKKVAIAADVMLIAGGVAVAAGVLWLVLGSDGEKDGAQAAISRVRAVPIAGRQGGGLMLEGSF